MKSAYIGVMLGVIGTTSMSLAMNLWKASATMGENELPWYKRTRYLVGVCMALFINPPVDAIAFSMAPLSLIAPLQGLTIALAVLFAALGISGYRESVSRKQWQAIFCCISGLVVCSWYGPNSDSESAWWPLISHYYNPLWVIYCSTAYALGVITIIVQKIPALVRRVSGTMSWTLMLCCGSGLLAGLLQTQLKVFAQVLRSLAFDADVSCRDAPPDFCRYDVDVCPSFSEVYALDPICLFQVHIMGRTIPAYPVHWLIDWNAWALVSSAILQLNMMTSALESNVLSVSVPLYSTAVLLCTILAGVVFFGEGAEMSNLPAFFFGVLVTLCGLVILAREKGRQDELEKPAGQKEEQRQKILPTVEDFPADDVMMPADDVMAPGGEA